MCSSSQGDQPFNITWLKDGTSILGNAAQQQLPVANLPSDLAGGRLQNGVGALGGGAGGKSYSPMDSSLTINAYTPFSSIISIHNVTSRHNGNYTCRVSNRAGSVEYTAVLSVSGKFVNVFKILIIAPNAREQHQLYANHEILQKKKNLIKNQIKHLLQANHALYNNSISYLALQVLTNYYIHAYLHICCSTDYNK